MDEGDGASILPAALLRNKLCSDAKLSKRAALLLRRECNSIAAALLLPRADNQRTLEASDLWETLLSDSSHNWLVDRLGLWHSPGMADAPRIPADVPLPLPPSELDADGSLPRLIWRQAPSATLTEPAVTTPMHASLLENSLSGASPEAPPTTMHSAFLFDVQQQT